MAKKVNWYQRNGHVTVNDTELPYSLHTTILHRAVGEKKLAELWEMYKNARIIGRSTNEPTEQQIKIAEFAKKNSKMTRASVAEKMSVKVHVVKAAVQKVALWEYLHG